ncbi:hypothetical protein OQA88_1711 [Cercophora sp. LCS_1]
MDPRTSPQPATINYVRGDLRIAWPCWATGSLSPPANSKVEDPRFREANDLAYFATPAPAVVIKPKKKDLLAEMLQGVIENTPAPEPISDSESSVSSWAPPALEKVVPKPREPKRTNGRKAQDKSKTQPKKDFPSSGHKEAPAPSDSIDPTNLPDSPPKKGQARSTAQAKPQKRKPGDRDLGDEEYQDLAQAESRPRKVAKTAPALSSRSKQSTSKPCDNTASTTSAASLKGPSTQKEEAIETEPTAAHSPTKQHHDLETNHLVQEDHHRYEGAFTQALGSNLCPGSDTKGYKNTPRALSKEPSLDPVDLLNIPSAQRRRPDSPEDEPAFLPEELEHVVRLSPPVRSLELQPPGTSSSGLFVSSDRMQPGNYVPNTAMSASRLLDRAEANVVHSSETTCATPPTDEQTLAPSTPRPNRMRNPRSAENPFMSTDPFNGFAARPMLNVKNSTDYQGRDGEERWRRATEDDSPPAVLCNIIKSVHRSLKPREQRIEAIAQEYKTNGKRLISDLSSAHALERSQSVEAYQQASRTVLAAFNKAEADMARVVEELQLLDVDRALAVVSHPNFVEKLGNLCRLFDKKFSSKYSNIDSGADSTPDARDSAGVDEDVVQEMQARLLEEVKKPDEPFDLESKKIHAEVDLLLQGHLNGDTEMPNPPSVVRELKSPRDKMYDSMEGYVDGLMRYVQEPAGEEDPDYHRMGSEYGGEDHLEDEGRVDDSDGSHHE